MAETSAGLRGFVFALSGDNFNGAGRIFAGPFRDVVLSGAVRLEIFQADPVAAVVAECDSVTGQAFAIGELTALIIGFSIWPPVWICDPWQNLAGFFGTHAENHHGEI